MVDHSFLIDPALFQKEGLYLVFDDGTRVEFIKDQIESLAEEYWNDPEKIPPEVKKTLAFQPCDHCPQHGNDVLCKALRPLLPYVESVDRYMSYDEVTAVFRQKNPDRLHVSRTTTQEALVYLSILCMLHYCEMSERYKDYIRDVRPLMDGEEICRRIYSNIYLIHEGNEEKMASVIPEFKREVFESAECLADRLGMICSRDAFVNAFVNANAVVNLLDFDRFRR